MSNNIFDNDANILECPVCYEKMESKDILKPCNHNVHHSCIQKSQKLSCPLCRAKITNVKLIEEVTNKFSFEVTISSGGFNNLSYYEEDTSSLEDEEDNNTFYEVRVVETTPKHNKVRNTLNTLKMFKENPNPNSHSNEFIDEDINFVKSLLRGDTIEDMSMREIDRICSEAIGRCYNRKYYDNNKNIYSYENENLNSSDDDDDEEYSDDEEFVEEFDQGSYNVNYYENCLYSNS